MAAFGHWQSEDMKTMVALLDAGHYAEAMDTHSSQAFLANSAATNGSLPSRSNSPPTWPSHRPAATFSILRAFLLV